MNFKKIMKVIEDERKELGLTKRAWSKVIGMKNEMIYYHYRSGLRNPGLEVVVRMYTRLGLDLNSLKHYLRK